CRRVASAHGLVPVLAVYLRTSPGGRNGEPAMSEKANAASLALIRGDEVLLIRRALPPYAKLWTFPGGRMEAGESAEECARREVREELGVTVAGLGHVETQVLAGTRWRLAVYASEEFTGEIEPSAEILEYRWTR